MSFWEREISRRDSLKLAAASPFLVKNALKNIHRAEPSPPKDNNFKKEIKLFSDVCPIFYMHEIPSQKYLSYIISYYQNLGWEAIRFSDLYNFLTTGEKAWSSQPFILTFDDGFMSQKENAIPVLKEFKVPALFCVMPNFNNGVFRYMGPDDFREIEEMNKNGEVDIEWASHTIDHPQGGLPPLRIIDEGAWRAQIIESKERLEIILGKPIDFFTYPEGAYDPPTVQLVSENYKAALSTNRGYIQRSDEIYLLRRGYPYQ